MDTQQPTQSISSQSGQKMHPAARNFFLYFLNFALLYTVAINLGGLLFDFINKAFPIVGEYARGRFSQDALRFHLASLIIGTPIFLWLAWKVYTDAKRDENFSKSGLRRWLTYITLIVTALIVIGDLIFLVNNLLGGETSMRVLLKALSVLAIAVAVFFYYLQDIRSMRYDAQQGAETKKPLPRVYFIGTLVVVLVGIVFGLFQIERPVEIRLRKQDEVRIRNLQEIENSVSNYVSVRQALPPSLSDLQIREDATSDPVTKAPYEYRILSNVTYEVCATFETSNKKGDVNDYYGYYGSAWLHDKGRVCFERSVRSFLPNKPNF